MKYALAILLCLTLAGCAFLPVPSSPSEYRTRAMLVDFDTQTVDVDWIKSGNPDRCGVYRMDYAKWQGMSDDELFREILATIRDSDVRFGADCARKTR